MLIPAVECPLPNHHPWVPPGPVPAHDAELQAERLTVTPFAPDDSESGYGLGLFNINGWIGHNGSLPGYKTVTVYLPEKEMTLVVMANSDVDGESDVAPELLTPITELLTPKNIYSTE